MITNAIADAVISKAKFELVRDQRLPAQTRRNEPLGEFVMLVFDAVTGGEHSLPFNDELAKCNSPAECRRIILSIAK